jgi:hypothetical protein
MNLDRREMLLLAASGLGSLPFAAPELLAQVGAQDAAGRIAALAATSPLNSYRWLDRGRAPRGYVKGMAVAFGRSYCKVKTRDPAARAMAVAATADQQRDALAWYASVFAEAGMDNSSGGPQVLRHLFVLLTGLGMRESSGKHCEGRDMSATNVTAETSETGLFQVSFNSMGSDPLRRAVYQAYRGRTDFAAIFGEGVTCRPASWRDWGTGPGVEFQRLTKACPAFAVEYAALLLRSVRRHWGPINARRAEVRPEADALFRSVQTLIDSEGITSV